jgi:hypothetical protein
MVAPKTTKEAQHNVEFAEGGDTPMFGPQAAEPMKPGTTRDKSGQDSAPGAKFAKGGSTKMFGFTPAAEAKSGITSAR